MERTWKNFRYVFTLLRFKVGAKGIDNIEEASEQLTSNDEKAQGQERSIWKKAYSVFGSLMFILFAALQYNDPDAPVWIAVYLFAALFCALGFKKDCQKVIVPIVFALFALEVFYFTPQFSFAVEEFRDGCGMLIAAGWLAIAALL